MTAGQRAMVAARAMPMFETLHPMGRPKKSGRSVQSNGKGSRDDAAAIFAGDLCTTWYKTSG
jgi:hypothetical protein